MLKKADWCKLFGLFIPYSTLHLQLSWEDTSLSTLRNWRTGTLFTDIQETTQNHSSPFCTWSPTNITKIYLHDSKTTELNYVSMVEKCYGITASQHLLTTIWPLSWDSPSATTGPKGQWSGVILSAASVITAERQTLWKVIQPHQLRKRWVYYLRRCLSQRMPYHAYSPSRRNQADWLRWTPDSLADYEICSGF